MGKDLQEYWTTIARELELTVEVPFSIDIQAPAILEVDVLLRQFGGREGTIIVSDFSRIQKYTEKLVSLGFGYSCVSEPSTGSSEGGFEEVVSLELGDVKEMLIEWGFTGTSDSRPKWMDESDSGSTEVDE